MVSASMLAVSDWDEPESMHNLFITTLPEPIDSWVSAFPSLSCASALGQEDFTEAPMVWLHQQSSDDVALQATIETIGAVRQRNPQAKVVVLANQPETHQTVLLIQAGAFACCHAYADPSVLTKVQHVVAEGGLWLGEAVLQQLIHTTKEQAGNSPIAVDTLLAKLTRREQQVAQEVVKGSSNKAIARELGITERTVKAHMASIFERLGVKDRLQLALMLNQKH